MSILKQLLSVMMRRQVVHTIARKQDSNSFSIPFLLTVSLLNLENNLYGGVVDIKTIQHFLLSDGSICPGLLQEAIKPELQLGDLKTQGNQRSFFVWGLEFIFWEGGSCSLLPSFFHHFLAGRAVKAGQWLGWRPAVEPAVGVQDAGCEPWLCRQDNRGMILTARGGGKWMESLVVYQ